MIGNQPDTRYINRFSILLATLATFLGALYLMPREPLNPGTNLFGFILNFSLIGAVPIVLMLLCAGGCFWLFVTHPDRDKLINTPWVLTPNVVLPSLATLITSTMLTQLERNSTWWIALAISLLIIGVILNAEYRVLTPGGGSLQGCGTTPDQPGVWFIPGIHHFSRSFAVALVYPGDIDHDCSGVRRFSDHPFANKRKRRFLARVFLRLVVRRNRRGDVLLVLKTRSIWAVGLRGAIRIDCTGRHRRTPDFAQND